MIEIKCSCGELWLFDLEANEYSIFVIDEEKGRTPLPMLQKLPLPKNIKPKTIVLLPTGRITFIANRTRYFSDGYKFKRRII